MYTSSGILRYLIMLPRMKHSGILQNLSPSYSGGKLTDLLHMTYTLLTHSRCAYNLPQMNVHPRVTADQMPIVGLSIFQLHQLQTMSQLSQFFNTKPNSPLGGSVPLSIAKVEALEQFCTCMKRKNKKTAQTHHD